MRPNRRRLLQPRADPKADPIAAASLGHSVRGGQPRRPHLDKSGASWGARLMLMVVQPAAQRERERDTAACMYHCRAAAAAADAWLSLSLASCQSTKIPAGGQPDWQRRGSSSEIENGHRISLFPSPSSTTTPPPHLFSPRGGPESDWGRTRPRGTAVPLCGPDNHVRSFPSWLRRYPEQEPEPAT